MEQADPNELAANEGEDGPEPPAVEICTAESCPGRTVFSESGNPEAWIGTDLAVEVPR